MPVLILAGVRYQGHSPTRRYSDLPALRVFAVRYSTTENGGITRRTLGAVHSDIAPAAFPHGGKVPRGATRLQFSLGTMPLPGEADALIRVAVASPAAKPGEGECHLDIWRAADGAWRLPEADEPQFRKVDGEVGHRYKLTNDDGMRCTVWLRAADESEALVAPIAAPSIELLAAGDRVRLALGGPTMLVTALRSHDRVRTTWIERDRVMHTTFPLAALVRRADGDLPGYEDSIAPWYD